MNDNEKANWFGRPDKRHLEAAARGARTLEVGLGGASGEVLSSPSRFELGDALSVENWLARLLRPDSPGEELSNSDAS